MAAPVELVLVYQSLLGIYGDRGNATVLAKRLVLSSDDLPELGADLEGVAVLSARSLLIVNDNDFGIEGVATRFWRVDLPRALRDYPSAE